MIVRDPWSGTTVAHQAAAYGLGAVPGASLESLWREVWGLANALKQAMRDVVSAQLRGETAYVAARLQDVARLKNILAQTTQQFEVTRTDPALQVGVLESAERWIQESVPGAVAAIPNALIEAIRQIGVKAGVSLVQISLPIIGLGLVLLWLVGRAEQTATGRRVLRV